MDQQFLRIIDNEILIPGFEKSYTMIQISDTHLLVSDENSTPEHVQKVKEQEQAWQEVKKGFADLFGEPCGKEHEISTIQCFEKVMEYVKEQKPDLLVFSGDVLNYEHEEGYEYFQEYMKGYEGAWLFVPGNHDNDMVPKKLDIQGVQVHQLDGVRVIGIDNSRMTISTTDLKELKALLSDKEPSILVMHTPVETDYNKEAMSSVTEHFVIHKDKTDANGKEFIGLCEDKETPIVGVLCGHIHGYHKSQLTQDRQQICCSSGMIGFVHRITVRGE